MFQHKTFTTASMTPTPVIYGREGHSIIQERINQIIRTRGATKMDFGKHAALTYEETYNQDAGYVRWCLARHATASGTFATAIKYFQLRGNLDDMLYSQLDRATAELEREIEEVVRNENFDYAELFKCHGFLSDKP